MKRLQVWLDRQGRLSAKRPSLEEALLTDRAAGYLTYRLRYVGLRVGLRTLLHLAEIALFAQAIWPEFLAYFLIVRSACALFSTLYWGALEQMREEVRSLARARRWPAIRAVLDRWHWFAASSVLLQLSGLVWFIRHGPSPFSSFSILDVYAIACVGRLACDTFARTYHSGMFALRRIHRPLASLLVPDVLDVVGLLLLWPWLGAWSFGVVLFSVGLVRSGLTFRYTRIAYRASRIPPLRVRGLLWAFGQLRELSLVGATRHGLANVTAQLDSLVILVLVAGSAASPEALGMAALFHVLRPLMGAGFAWSRLFYFDLKRLSTRFGALMRARFERLLRRLSLVLSLGLGLLVMGLVPLFRFDIGAVTLLLLLPFLAVRSLFALHQVQAFSYARHDVLLRAALMVGVGLFAVNLWQPSPALLLITLMLVLLTAMLFGGQPALRPVDDARTGAMVNLPRFLALLTTAREPVQLWVGRVDRHLTQTHRATRGLLADPAVWCATRWGRSQLLWITRGQGATPPLRARLLIASAGCMTELTSGPPAPDGAEAFQWALRNDLWDPKLLVMLRGPQQDADPDALLRDFQATFTGGMCLDHRGRLQVLGSRRLSRADSWRSRLVHSRLSRSTVRSVLTQLQRLGDNRPLRTNTTAEVDVAVFGPGGEARLIFVMGHDAPSDTRLAWRRRVWAASLQASVVRAEHEASPARAAAPPHALPS